MSNKNALQGANVRTSCISLRTPATNKPETNTVNTQKSPPWACDRGCAEACAERFSALKRSSQALGSNGRRKERGAQGRHQGGSSPLACLSRALRSFFRPLLASACYVRRLPLSKGGVTRDDSQRRLLARHCVAMLQLFETMSQQCCNAALKIVATNPSV